VGAKARPQSGREDVGATLVVRVQPRASRNEVVGWQEEALRIRLTAPPVEGAANAACRDFLAKSLGLPRRQVTLIGGERSRMKRFLIAGLTPAGLKARITRLLGQ